MEVRFGIHYSCQSPAGDWERIYQETLDQARRAGTLVYDLFSVAEHHFLPDGWMPAPTVFLGALAAVTEEAELVTNIVILPLHHPVAVAERATVLDLLSNGRFTLGVAIGWRDEEFDAFGIDKSERVPRTVEGPQLVRRLLTEQSVTYDGDFYDVEALTLQPRPVQASMPIWYGGQSEYAILRAARLADAWSMSPIETREELASSMALYREEVEAAGRSIDDVRTPLRREAYVAEDDETAWEEVGPALLYEYEDVYGEYDEIGHTFDGGEDREAAIEALRDHAEDRFIVGGPETAIEQLERYVDDVGMTDVILRMHFPGLDTAKSAKSMELVDDEVLPHFRSG